MFKKFMVVSLLIILSMHAIKEISLKKGEILLLELESNRTTGYLWQLSKPVNDHIIKIIDSGYKEKKSSLIGSGGKQYWKIKGINSGTSEINLEYKRSWEKNIRPVQEKQYIIKVK